MVQLPNPARKENVDLDLSYFFKVGGWVGGFIFLLLLSKNGFSHSFYNYSVAEHRKDVAYCWLV